MNKVLLFAPSNCQDEPLSATPAAPLVEGEGKKSGPGWPDNGDVQKCVEKQQIENHFHFFHNQPLKKAIIYR